jgi:HYDIN/CFA65/VesB family protein/NHL repeat-containing protein
MRKIIYNSKTISSLLLAFPLLGLPALAQQDIISTVIGGGPSDMPAVDADIANPQAVSFDSAGNYYIATGYTNRVYKVNTSGLLTLVAGNGLPGYAGDGVAGGAVNALLNNPSGVAADSSGNVYISDTNNQVIRKVDATGTITTVAGRPSTCTYNGNGSPATNYDLCIPENLAVDSSNNLYIADAGNCLIRKLVPSTSTIGNYAGNGGCGYSGDGGLATNAELYYPSGVAVDGAANVYIADTNNYRIREVVFSTGEIETIAGIGTAGYKGDGGPATSATIGDTYGLAVNGAGTSVTIAETDYNLIRQFTVGGNINTVAGTGKAEFCGDGGPATSACFNYPYDVAVFGTGVYVADDDNNRVRQFTVGGDITTVAGNGSASMPILVTGVAPQGVVLYDPWGVLEDTSGNIFVSDQGNCMVRGLVESQDLVDFFAGDGTCGYGGDGQPATQAELKYPYGVARDSSGNIYIADTYNCIVREVDTSGVIGTFAGSPDSCGYSGDGGPATSAELSHPNGVYVDSRNNVYIADGDNSVIRKVTNGTITTVAGDGQSGFSGDGGPAIAAELNNPSAVTADGAGNLYIADTTNNRIREIVADTGNINTVAGNGYALFSGDGIATQNSLYYPWDVKADANGNLFIADTSNQRLRWVTPGGIMTTFAGAGLAEYKGDGGPAPQAELDNPTGIFEDASGSFLVADEFNLRIRGITAFAGLGASTYSLTFGLVYDGATSAAQAITLSAVGSVSITGILVGSQFEESDDCPSSLTNGQVCKVYVYFKPTGSGAVTGTLTVENSGYFSDATTVNLQGSATAIDIAGAPVSFGDELTHSTSAAKSVTITNKGKTKVTMGAITLTETTDFTISSNTCPASGKPLAAKAACKVSLTFTPQSTGAKKGALVIDDSDPTSPQVVGVTGTGTSNVTFSPTSVSFAAQAVGTTSAATEITLTNKTGAAIALGNPAVSFTGPFLATASTTCTNSLPVANNGTCVIYVEFAPTAVGYVTGTLNVADTDSTSPQSVALTGFGSALEFTPAPLNVGSSTVGAQISNTLTVNNVGTETVTFTATTITGANATDFSLNGLAPCSDSLAPKITCTLKVYFTPSIVGSESAALTFYDSSAGSPQTVQLSGTGTN